MHLPTIEDTINVFAEYGVAVDSYEATRLLLNAMNCAYAEGPSMEAYGNTVWAFLGRHANEEAERLENGDDDRDEPWDGFNSDAEADADVLASAGWGMDEDYGCFNGFDD